MGEVYRLAYARNSHVAVSRLPAELLTEVFLCIVESGLDGDNARFAPGTFSFLQVCKHWNEVAVSFPQLWCWWVSGAVKAWPLFDSRSKDAPLSVIWRPQPASTPNILMDSRIPNRIHQLDFDGTSRQLAHFLGAFDSSPLPNALSIRIKILPYSYELQERLTHFLSLPFPKLSRLDLWNFLPKPSSPVFTTSNLTSLKLFLLYGDEDRYTSSQVSQVLQLHPNLQELDLTCGAIPLPEQADPLVPFVLPRLVNLRLHGMVAAISGFIDFVGMTSPLHNVLIRLGHNPPASTVSALAGVTKKILVAYYECRGLGYSREINHLTIVHNSEEESLVFDALSRSAPMSGTKSNLRFHFVGADALVGYAMMKEISPLFPLNNVREFTAEGPPVYRDWYREMFLGMGNLSHLHLNKQGILPALWALSPGN